MYTVNEKELKRPQKWGRNGDRKIDLFGGSKWHLLQGYFGFLESLKRYFLHFEAHFIII